MMIRRMLLLNIITIHPVTASIPGLLLHVVSLIKKAVLLKDFPMMKATSEVFTTKVATLLHHLAGSNIIDILIFTTKATSFYILDELDV